MQYKNLNIQYSITFAIKSSDDTTKTITEHQQNDEQNKLITDTKTTFTNLLRWTLYLRSPNPTYDLSNAISRVIFQLHPSFAQPTRELTKPPFEVTETGWGEFEASIRIVWREGVADERCTMVRRMRISVCTSVL